MRDQIVTLLGDRLSAPPVPEETRDKLTAQLETAHERVWEQPDDPVALVSLGRRTAYLGEYAESIRIFGEGVERWPENPLFYRHRGHRLITLRRFEEAVADFERAAALIAGTEDAPEPDGQPNARNIPTSTLHFNVWYHLALAHYLRGDFERALPAYRECMAVSTNPDALVATSHWLYMTLRRSDRAAEAAGVLEPVTEEMDVIENGAYHRLLLMYKGLLAPDHLLDAPTNSNATLHDGTGTSITDGGMRRSPGSAGSMPGRSGRRSDSSPPRRSWRAWGSEDADRRR